VLGRPAISQYVDGRKVDEVVLVLGRPSTRTLRSASVIEPSFFSLPLM
jgi:hypothetical protein